MNNTIRYEHDANGIVTLTFDEPGSSVNTMCFAWQEDLAAVVERIVAEAATIKGIVLASAKPSFFAGADLKSVMRLTADDAARCFGEIERMKKHLRTLERLNKPIVACLNGSALGGGWEVALVAHHLVAVDDPKIQFGFPEVTLGLIPGASGITKMTRLLGLLGAQPYLLEGKTFSPREAAELGLVNELVADAARLRERALAWIAEHPTAQQPWDDKAYKMPGGTPAQPKVANALTVAPAMLRKTTRGLYPAPEAVLEVMVEGAMVDYDTALRIESRHLAKIMTGPNARAMISAFFFDLNAIKSGRSRPKDVPRSRPLKVGVLGAGMMGTGIAWVNASRGIATVLKDVSLAKAQAGKDLSRQLAEARVAKGRMSAAEQAALLERITPTQDDADLRGCDLIVEAVFENRELKAAVTHAAEPMLVPAHGFATGVFASNTSTLPITGLARASARPEKFIGIHFFSPVDKMKLVEIIRGERTDDETVARAFDYVQALGKLPIVVNDSRGFFTSRVFASFVTEGAAMLSEGIPAAVIENAGLQAGMPVGPLAVLDETSLALSVHVLDQTRADFAAGGKNYEASAGERLIELMVKEHGRSGRPAGSGFYDYPTGARKTLWPKLKTLFEKPGVSWNLGELKDRLLWRQAVETARCLQEGVLTSVHEGNIGSIFGIGFPAWTGGALQLGYGMGVDRFAARAEQLAEKYGARFRLGSEVLDTLKRHQPRY
ncbi:3-hydroxyacyl-CoA dehydrogenase NAD-binding domain-containing protein [Piscinibacter sp.]|uniref:3-hydroxyacyl-CoA dehydrogenase NAD-binding domain-containing protein n=1 Tax=Piscinibacter sp. TaxID=1903157 RepID=UPI002D11FEE3|nr:3-hydroxyacyl-CoA dehydrogenase NAD-binding domain-containing protein [Albitalea sp.]HUG26145.1 3-hydroxyacyl-CoA dehydrogenase NAD-binding domain-containing protein [Albitalea sp.]